MKSFIIAILGTALFSLSAMANENLAQIMANHKDQLLTIGVQEATTNTLLSLIENHINQDDLNEFLKAELSPHDYKYVINSLQKDNFNQEVANNVIFNIGNGANFKGNTCHSKINRALLWGGTVVAIYFAYEYVTYRDAAIEMSKQDNPFVETEEGHIRMLQDQIQSLKERGYTNDSIFITSAENQITDTQMRIQAIRNNFDNAGAELARVGEKNKTLAALGIATVGVTALSCSL